MVTATKPFIETVGGDRKYNFHAAQSQAWNSEKRFVFMLAGSQGGKTSFGPPWLYREIQRCGPGDYLAVTATFPLLKLKMLPEFLSLFRDHFHLGFWHSSDKVFYFKDKQTRVIFGSATNPESLESATAKAAWLDEVGQDDFRLESWEAVNRRLALNQGRVFAGTTIYNLGWLKQQIYDRWLQGDSIIDVIQFASVVNPAFPQAEFERMKAIMPAWKFNMFMLGLFDRPAGLIYSDYTPTYREEGGHLVHPFDLPPEWPRYGGLDFGAVNTARLMVAEDPQAKVYYIYSESLSGGKTTREHVMEANTVATGVNMRTWHGGAKSETQQRRDWADAKDKDGNSIGIGIREPEVTDVESGIDKVISLFKTHRLYVFDTCSGLRDELGTYARELDPDGQVTEKIKDKETFHRLDALRYLVLGVEYSPSLPFGWLKAESHA